MVINRIKIFTMAIGFVLLLYSCKKPKTECLKDGVEYFHSSSLWLYSPQLDSISIDSLITFEASTPKNFRDEVSNTMVANTSSIITGPIGVAMIYPEYKSAMDSFELKAQVGSVYRDTTYLTEGAAKACSDISLGWQRSR